MEDALAVWPEDTAAPKLARLAVWACLQLSDGCATRGTRGRRITVPVTGGAIGSFLSAHHPRWRLLARMTLFRFLEEPRQRPFFVLTPSCRGDRIALNLGALRASAQLRAEIKPTDPRLPPGIIHIPISSAISPLNTVSYQSSLKEVVEISCSIFKDFSIGFLQDDQTTYLGDQSSLIFSYPMRICT